MKTLRLPGSSPATVDWIQRFSIELNLPRATTSTHTYDFWSREGAKPDLAKEVARLPKGKFDLVIGKSLGTIVLLQASFLGTLHFDRAILVGIPMKSLSTGRLDMKTLELLQSETVHVVQQKDDPFGSLNTFNAHIPMNFLTIEGNDHQYNDFSLYAADVAAWLGT